jgi:hypothetical protein
VSRDEIRSAADELRHSVVADPDVQGATVGEPIPIVGPDGELDSWFVPLITDNDVLLGFLQLEPDLTLHRYSAFGRPAVASTWLDRASIRARARAAASSGDALGEPVLTYRDNRDRLSWRVPIENRPAVIYVAGDHIEVAPAT